MIEIHHMDVDQLNCDELRADHITCESINGITKTELGCLHGVKSNIQQQIDALQEDFDELIASWS